jgi:hypothetical protein
LTLCALAAGGAGNTPLTPTLSPGYRGEGDQGAASVTAERDDYFGSREYQGEGDVVRPLAPLPFPLPRGEREIERPLTPTLSPEYRGEGDQGAASVTAEREDYFGSREYQGEGDVVRPPAPSPCPLLRGEREAERPRLPSDEAAEAGTWLSPVELQAAADAATSPPPVRRASNQGFLPLRLSDYLRLLDWTGHQARRDKRGRIPGELAPILERLQIAGESWLEMVFNFSRWFRRAAGRADSLAAEAARRGRHWLHGITRSRAAFA